jgi:hypothetical protein
MISPDSFRAGVLTMAVAAVFAGTLWWDASRTPAALESDPSPVVAQTPAQPSAERFATQHFARQQPQTPSRGIYRCEAAGRTVYQAAPCPSTAQQAPVSGGTVSIVEAPSREQLARLQSLSPGSDNQQPGGSMALIARSDNASDVEERCTWLQQEIKQIDAMGRQPHTSQGMEWLRDRRREVKDEMWRLKCGFPPS